MMLKTLSDYKFIDIHYHANPDLYERRWSALDAGRFYAELGGAVVLKSHLGSTAVQATIAQKEGLPVFASLVLNAVAGGIDYRVVMRTLAEYQPVIESKLLVHFPTITGRQYSSKLQRSLSKSNLEKHLLRSAYIFQDNDHYQIKNEVLDIIKMSKDYPIVLSSGHASKQEVYALIDVCAAHQVPLLLNQPANPLTGLNAEELLAITQCPWVWIEQTFLTYALGYQSLEDFNYVIKSVPRVIYSSDLGQTSQIDITEWGEESRKKFQELQLSRNRKEELCKTHPQTLLSL